MPINVSYGSTLEIAVQFFSSAGILTVPTSATLTITYAPVGSLVTTSCAIGMTANNSTFIATWGTGVAALGIVNYSIAGAGQVSPTTGSWRITS